MASFHRKKLEDIRAAVKIGELRPDPSDNAFKEYFDFKVTRGECWHVVFAPDESYFAWICSPRKVLLVPWDGNKNCLSPLRLPDASMSSTEENPERPCITIECGYPVLSVAFGSGIPLNTLLTTGIPKTQKAYWTRYDFTADIIVATGHTNGRIRIWNVRNGKLLLELIDHKLAVRDLAFAPDGSLRLISASLDKTLKGWDLNDDGNMFKTFFAHKDAVIWCCWSPNASMMASAGSDKTVFLWDMKDYKLTRKLEGHSHEVVSCSFSPDGALLATASWDTQVILWDPYTGEILHKLYHLHPPPKMIYASGANSAWVRGVSYDKTGTHLVTISDDHLIRFWNLMGDVDPEGIATEGDDTLSCAYSPSGRSVAIGTNTFKVNFYTSPMEVPRLMHLARMAIRKNMLTSDVELLEVPNSLKRYLKYETMA